MSRVDQANLSNAYAFWIISLIFGLPLLTSFYAISFLPNYATVFLVPYLLVCVIVGILILRFGRSRHSHADFEESSIKIQPVPKSNDWLLFAALTFGTVAVASYGGMKYFLAHAYPSISQSANVAGAIYLVSTSIAVLLGFPAFLERVFPSVRSALKMKTRGISYSKIAVLVGIAYFVTYLLLVNQIIITGFNTQPGNFVSSPNGVYPYAFVFTQGPPPSATVESLVYIPYVLLQINPYVNFIFQPFEMLFAIAMSTLVAVTFVLTMYFIRRTAWHSCATGAAASGLAGFLGLTATCPSCLAPTLVSAFFGGLSATVQSSYSNLSGVVLPPIVSIASLLAATIYLDYRTKRLETRTATVNQI